MWLDDWDHQRVLKRNIIQDCMKCIVFQLNTSMMPPTFTTRAFGIGLTGTHKPSCRIWRPVTSSSCRSIGYGARVWMRAHAQYLVRPAASWAVVHSQSLHHLHMHFYQTILVHSHHQWYAFKELPCYSIHFGRVCFNSFSAIERCYKIKKTATSKVYLKKTVWDLKFVCIC